ncbi:MAG: hypothetical protein HZA31_07135, partial [Opitutae bacterium]|nr:hypothetical protein [Opitutae bacterium]
ALAAAGVASPLADPILRVYRNGVLVAENDNWSATAADAATLADAAKQTGAFAFATGSKDAALLLTLQPGNYTAQVSGAGTTTGIALVEIYELSE